MCLIQPFFPSLKKEGGLRAQMGWSGFEPACSSADNPARGSGSHIRSCIPLRKRHPRDVAPKHVPVFKQEHNL